MTVLQQNRFIARPDATLPALQITTASLPGATQGSAYSTSLAAAGGKSPYTWSTLSIVPNTGSWLSCSSSGILSGTPGSFETETVLVQVQDSLGTKASSFFSLIVAAGGSNFTPDPGFSISSPSGVSNGSIITIGANSGTPFGTKPFGVNPLLWVPCDTDGNPHPTLSRITSLQSFLMSQMTWQSTGGPTGAGCYKGDTSTNTIPNNWAIGIDVAQWSGWAAADPFGGNNGYWLNDYGVSTYWYRREKRNFGHLDQSATLSYNGVGNYNTKNARVWPVTPKSAVGSAGTLSNVGDFYLPPSDQIFEVENISNTWGLGTDFPSGGGSQDWAGECIAACVSAENVMNGAWCADEKLFTTNSTSSAADANVMWRVPSAPTQGPFPLGSIFNFPVTTYHTIGWQMLNASIAQTVAGHARGTLSRAYAYQFVVEGNDGSGRPSAPVGAFPMVSNIYFDDSPCRVIATNSPTWGSETDLQPQPPTAWIGNSVSVSAYNIPLNWYIYVVNSSNVSTRVGRRTS